MSNARKFEPGQTVYSIHGESASFVAATSNGYAVEPMYEYEDGELHFGPVTSWPEVYVEPPVAKLFAKVQELERVIAERRATLSQLDVEKRAMDSELLAMQRRYKENDQLRNLDLWLSGACTHIVKLTGYGFEIGPVEKVLGCDSDKEIRLLSIYGGSKRHYRWKMASYSDGSGSSTPVLLATSEDDAKREAAKWFNAEVVERGRNNQDHMVIGLARDAIKYGISVSDDLRALVAKQEEDGIKQQIEQAEKNFERAKVNLDNLKAEVAK